MKKTTLDYKAMTEVQRERAVIDLARILYPAKSLHVLTLVALTSEGYQPLEDPTT